MSLIFQRVQKAQSRRGGINLDALRRKMVAAQPLDVASGAELEERRSFLLHTCSDPRHAEMAYERIIHGNELQDVNYLLRGWTAARSVGRIWIREPNGTFIGYGTGFMIGAGVLITNNHVLPSEEWAQRSEVEMEFERDEQGNELAGVKFSLQPERLFFTHEKLDFTVVAVAAQALNAERGLAEFGMLPLIGGVGKAMEGEWLTIIQHPKGERKQVCVRENQLLHKGEDVLWYSTDTLGGSSGAPVFNNDWQVVALHHSGVPEKKDGRWQTISGQDFDERVHGEEDIKWVANEGIRVSRIVQTLSSEVGGHALVQGVLAAGTAESQPGPSTTGSPIFSPSAPSIIHPHPTPMNPTETNLSQAGRKYLLSFDAAGLPSITPYTSGVAAESALLLERNTRRNSRNTEPRGMRFRFDDDYNSRKGYDVDFLGSTGDKGKHKVHLPTLKPALEKHAVRLLEAKNDKDYVLHYTNMSLVMHEKRCLAMYSAANLDYARRYKMKTPKTWRVEPRIPLEVQTTNEAYEGNTLDRGHLSRQEDLEFGDTMNDAKQSAADSCHYTNAVPQHDYFNQNTEWWQGIEQHILEFGVKEDTGKGFKAQVFTGPVFSKTDPDLKAAPGVLVPLKFWKVCAAVTSSGKLFAVAYLVDQSKFIKKYKLNEAAGEIPFEPYRYFQLPIKELEEMIHMTFTYGPQKKPLSDCDPLKDGIPPALDADQDGYDDRYESTGGEEPTPSGWINLDRHRPFFG